jgi:ribosomal protein S12 methylthiotransferase accessory factor
MGRQIYYPKNRNDKLTPTVPISHFLSQEFLQPLTPFKKQGFFARVTITVLKVLSRIIEHIIGRSVLIANSLGELAMYEQSSRAMLESLLEKGLVTKWECGLRSNDKPGSYLCSLIIGEITNSEHGVVCPANYLSGHGDSEKLTHSLKVALAETIERIVATQWLEEKLLRYSVEELSLRKIPHFIKSYIPEQSIDPKASVGWLWANILGDDKRILVPASIVYLFYQWFHPQEPLVLNVSTNGVATHSNPDLATLGAVYESIERDGFLMYWLLSIAPQIIVLDASTDTVVKEIADSFKRDNIEFYLLNCRNEFGVPVVTSVLVDRVTRSVCVYAACDMSPSDAIRKAATDALRWSSEDTPVDYGITDFNKIITLNHRRSVWRGSDLIDEINFFLSGEEIPYSEYLKQFTLFLPPKLSPKAKLRIVEQKLSSCGIQTYIVDLSNDLSRQYGLHVKRAIIPDLIPIYFMESQPHTNVDRLRTFAANMGYSDRGGDVVLNKTPHPFI